MDMEEMLRVNRVLIEADLQPIQGTRFQPTGFPDLGAATYQAADGTQMLLVESAQSMANRLEAVCIDPLTNSLKSVLEGLPYVSVYGDNGEWMTNSLLESHRLNSPYIIESKDVSFRERLIEEMGVKEVGVTDMRQVCRVLLKYDVNSLIHGVFMAKKDFAGGRVRVSRALTAFIEARDAKPASSGGVKLDSWNPKGDTKSGFGNVPFHRDEYTGDIKAYFNIDVAQIRGYGLPKQVESLIMTLCLYKILAFLDGNMKLRTACDLRLDKVRITLPQAFEMPTIQEVESVLPGQIASCRQYFADPPVTDVVFK